MKTAVTVIDTIQTGIDSFKDVRTTKIFYDTDTLMDIKNWVHDVQKLKITPSEVSIACLEFSDVKE